MNALEISEQNEHLIQKYFNTQPEYNVPNIIKYNDYFNIIFTYFQTFKF